MVSSRPPIPAPAVTAVPALVLMLLLGSGGAAVAAKDDPARQLDSVQKDLKAGQARQQELDARAEALEKELADLRAKLIQSAEESRRQEEDLARLEQALDGLARDEQQRSARIEADRAALAELLGALQRLSRVPPEALIARPGAPADTVKSALLLRAAVPELKARADALSAELAGLAAAREKLAAQRRRTEVAAKALAARQAEMQRLAAKREALLNATDAERQQVVQRVAALATQAADLKDLLEKLEAERRAAEARRQAAEAAKRAAAEAEREQRAKQKVAQLGRAPGKSDLGGMVLPVGGEVQTRYGEQDSLGTTSRGVTLTGRAGSAVVAPYEGSVMFAGPFKGYGLILILDHGHGYHSLLAGLGKIDAGVGQRVLTGEPVGTMAGDGRPTLYFELRRGGQPINPLRGLAASDGKGQG